MSVERIDKLEKSVIKMESTVSQLAEKMSDVADSLNTMSQAVSQLAVFDMKLDMLKQDIQAVADAHRTLEDKVHDYHADHAETCNTKLEGTRDDFNKLSLTRFFMGVSAATFLFGYLWVQLHDEKLANEKISKALTFTKIRVEKLKGEINVLNEKCNGK